MLLGLSMQVCYGLTLFNLILLRLYCTMVNWYYRVQDIRVDWELNV